MNHTVRDDERRIVPEQTTTLAALPRGTEAVVAEVTGPVEDTSRLKALGICQGRTLQLLQHGDPLVVRVLGTRIGLASRLASLVRVRSAAASTEAER